MKSIAIIHKDEEIRDLLSHLSAFRYKVSSLSNPIELAKYGDSLHFDYAIVESCFNTHDSISLLNYIVSDTFMCDNTMLNHQIQNQSQNFWFNAILKEIHISDEDFIKHTAQSAGMLGEWL